MRIALSGVTGAAGSEILRAALNDPTVNHVTALSRRPLPAWLDLPPAAKEGKLEVILIKDFLNYPEDIAKKLANHDAFVWALGKTAQGMSEKDYTVLTYDYTLAAVKAIEDGGVASNPTKPFRFVFISGEGASAEEKSFQMWANIKGRTETALANLPPSSNIVGSSIRPGYFFPSAPGDRQNMRGGIGRLLDTILGPVVANVLPFGYTPVESLGKFAIEVAKGRWPEERLFSNVRMRKEPWFANPKKPGAGQSTEL